MICPNCGAETDAEDDVQIFAADSSPRGRGWTFVCDTCDTSGVLEYE